MDELLAKAQQNVDANMPGAFLSVFMNLMAMLPWAVLFWWNLAFVIVGGLLGWWRGRLLVGLLWSFVLGPFGWLVVFTRPRLRQVRSSKRPPPLPR